MALDFRDGDFRVSVCEHGHVTLEIVGDDGLVKVVCTLTGSEAGFLSMRLWAACEAAHGATVFDVGPAQM